MIAKLVRASRTSLYVLLTLLGLYAIFVFFGNFQQSLSIKSSRKGNVETLESRFRKEDASQSDAKEERLVHVVENPDENHSKLREIEALLYELNNKLNQNNQINDTKKRDDVARTRAPDNFILPLDFSRSSPKVPGDLDRLLETPGNPPRQRYGVPMDELTHMMDPNYRHSKCPKTLSSIARYSSWFRERYKPGLKMFLDEHDIYNFTNYYKLSSYGMPFGYATVDRTVLGQMINNPNFTNAPLTDVTDRCVRCAVVGCGGILNGSNAGKEIDSHDFVFRVNRALTTDKFAKDVGTKTSFYEFFPESQNIWTVQDPNAAFLFTPFKKVDLYYAEYMLRRNDSLRNFNVQGEIKNFFRPPLLDPGRVKITHPDFFRYIFTHFFDLKGYRPTTGALVVFTAIYLCDEVTIYGFGYDPRFTIHYYDEKFIKITDQPTGAHDIDNERIIWNKLHSEGVIKFFKRDF